MKQLKFSYYQQTSYGFCITIQNKNVRLKHLFHHPLIYHPSSIRDIEMMVTPERKNNRGKIQIMGDVLALGTSGIRKTHIMYKANLSYEQVHLYLGELIGKRLIEQDVSPDGVVYRTTEKGREFLRHYTRVLELLEEEARQESEAEFRSPYISTRSWVR
jgi:predicted transcriptional regulator